MASSRGILNIQSLNELTSENGSASAPVRCAARTAAPRTERGRWLVPGGRSEDAGWCRGRGGINSVYRWIHAFTEYAAPRTARASPAGRTPRAARRPADPRGGRGCGRGDRAGQRRHARPGATRKDEA